MSESDLSPDERLEQLEDAVRDISAAYTDLSQVLEAIAQGQGDPQETEAEHAAPSPEDSSATKEPVAYGSWADQADAQAWIALMDWTDWFIATYQTGEPSLMGCWTRHPGVVEDVAALKMAWEQAVAACAEDGWRGNEALEYWHDRYLPGFFHRVRVMHGMSRCESTHEEQRGKRITSDREGAVVAATGEKARA